MGWRFLDTIGYMELQTKNEVSLAIDVLVYARYIRGLRSLPTSPYLTVCLLVKNAERLASPDCSHFDCLGALFQGFSVSHLKFPSHSCVILEIIIGTAAWF